MPVKLGSTNVASINLGTTPLQAVYLGTTLLFSSTPPISITGATNYYSSGAVSGFTRFKSVTSALSVSGGTGTYSYSWALISGANLIGSTTVLNPTFSASVPPDTMYDALYRLTVTSGSATATYDVYIALTN